jgi:hypothetical protein
LHLNVIFLCVVVVYSLKMETAIKSILASIYNAFKSKISFDKNGLTLGVAFTNVDGEEIAPVVE